MGELLKYNSYELRDIKIKEYIDSYVQLKGCHPGGIQLSMISNLTLKEIDAKIKEMRDRMF
tara:strand:+ start:418 stop:600 length:183 start_codon:yes stop_codon:yes gene_type:complete